MNILVFTRGAWRNDNNIGNTMTNFFSDFSQDNIYGLCLRQEEIDNSILKKNFCISESQIIKSLLKKDQIGQMVDCGTHGLKVQDDHIEKNIYQFSKKHYSHLLPFMRELLWSVASWKNSKLNAYLDEIKPDIIFMPVFGCWYPHKILKYLHQYTNAKIVLFHADDNYTLKKYSLSPFYWIYRIILRKWVKKSVAISDLNYAISELQKREYESAFQKEFKILYKGYSFETPPRHEHQKDHFKIVFTGNIGVGRYQSLAKIGKAVANLNNKEKKAELDVYTLTPLSKKMKKELDFPGALYLKGGISAEAVAMVQARADVLVHAEAFSLKNKLAVRQSFSTKIVDYFKEAKCILAVGPMDVASMDYLAKNDAAVTASSEKEIEEKLRELIENPELLQEYGQKAWECGKRNHQRKMIQEMLQRDFEEIIHESSAN